MYVCARTNVQMSVSKIKTRWLNLVGPGDINSDGPF